jgi:hypothetical protein
MAPVPRSQESRCPETTTICSGCSEPLRSANDVVAGLVGKLLRSEGEMHADLALRGEVDDEIGIFGGHGAGGIPAGKLNPVWGRR